MTGPSGSGVSRASMGVRGFAEVVLACGATSAGRGARWVGDSQANAAINGARNAYRTGWTLP